MSQPPAGAPPPATSAQPAQPQWLSPLGYPTRCDDALATGIARHVLDGATLYAAAMAYGVAPSRVRAWMHWGEEAYKRDAGLDDRHAAYLNLYLKVMQAVGMAALPVQQTLRATAPLWWLTHHPEQRGEWGGEPTDLIATDAVAADGSTDDAQQPPTALQADPPKLRTILRMLVESGAADDISVVDTPAAAPPIVDAADDESATA